ncbi:MAG: integrase family protein [uncultured bacterium]|nr:MAG: integrase family protein [uncultured bacterium]
MGLLVECPECKKRVSLKKKTCSCGFQVGKAAGKNYWIEYYHLGRRKRERIGRSKAAAENRLREVETAKAEGKHIDKDPATVLSLGELVRWYGELPEVVVKKSYRRDMEMTRHLLRILGEETKVAAITTGMIEGYQKRRLGEPSIKKGKDGGPKLTAAATVNKEIVTLKTIFNRAIRHGKLAVNPAQPVRKLPENNVRMRILTAEEAERLFTCCADHLRPVVTTAFYTGMRLSEIVNLTWSKIDLAKGFIRLEGSETKTGVGRSIPLHPRVLKLLRGLPRGLHTDRVFLKRGKPFSEFKHSYSSAKKKAEIEDFTFHDLRHCAINNMRLAGNDYFRIMAASGHKTTAVFKRYNLVTEKELSEMKWLSEESQEDFAKAGGDDRRS